MTLAVTGASGQLGRLAIAKLKTLVPADSIVALARTPEKIADLGVEARAFDYTTPETLAPALEGVEVLALISSSDFNDRAGQHRNVIEAAKSAGVKRLVYTSILKADQTPLLIAQDHKATEALLAASGLTTTILRNGWYTENWTGALPTAIEAGALIGAVGNGRVSPATRQDYAEALAAVLAGDGHDNKIYELGGEVFTMPGLAAELSKQTGKDIPYNNLDKATYETILRDFGLPDGFAALLADADAGAAEGWLLDESGTLAELIGRAPTPMHSAVTAALG
ncbi:SDR family oxidoreductase [Phaeobacter sp. HF9A]|uniref:SDR family oxidoreductase n=1 Tax=Phaeobacter sp. HF9A TaxID=2721561 RepID=UPI001431F678|nr:SDR family oxidoreductase [Phaeobacter sp. HF9A]NIZ12779.1 SDR family oxidoreductase [Phaeobacter sp. HF9A]